MLAKFSASLSYLNLTILMNVTSLRFDSDFIYMSALFINFSKIKLCIYILYCFQSWALKIGKLFEKFRRFFFFTSDPSGGRPHRLRKPGYAPGINAALLRVKNVLKVSSLPMPSGVQEIVGLEERWYDYTTSNINHIDA